jgi:hypothetical protein
MEKERGENTTKRPITVRRKRGKGKRETEDNKRGEN